MLAEQLEINNRHRTCRYPLLPRRMKFMTQGERFPRDRDRKLRTARMPAMREAEISAAISWRFDNSLRRESSSSRKENRDGPLSRVVAFERAGLSRKCHPAGYHPLRAKKGGQQAVMASRDRCFLDPETAAPPLFLAGPRSRRFTYFSSLTFTHRACSHPGQLKSFRPLLGRRRRRFALAETRSFGNPFAITRRKYLDPHHRSLRRRVSRLCTSSLAEVMLDNKRVPRTAESAVFRRPRAGK